MDDLVQFLRARLDEDEPAARAATPGPWAVDGGSVYVGHPINEVVDYSESADHIARHDPARVLAEVDAKRRLVAQVLRYEAKIDGEWGCCHSGDQIAAGQCEETNPNEIEALQLLALPYATHPDYREEWRPTDA